MPIDNLLDAYNMEWKCARIQYRSTEYKCTHEAQRWSWCEDGRSVPLHFSFDCGADGVLGARDDQMWRHVWFDERGDFYVLEGRHQIQSGARLHAHVGTDHPGLNQCGVPIEGLGRDYFEQSWQATVTSTGAVTVIPIHFDDYTRPFSVVELLPTFLDDFSETVLLMEEFRRTWDSDAQLYLPVFGEAMPIYPEREPEA